MIFSEPKQWYENVLTESCLLLENGSHVKNMAHGPLVYITNWESRMLLINLSKERSAVLMNLFYLQLFYITTNVYQDAKGGTKELQKWAFEIFSTFLANGAVCIATTKD